MNGGQRFMPEADDDGREQQQNANGETKGQTAKNAIASWFFCSCTHAVAVLPCDSLTRPEIRDSYGNRPVAQYDVALTKKNYKKDTHHEGHEAHEVKPLRINMAGTNWPKTP